MKSIKKQICRSYALHGHGSTHKKRLMSEGKTLFDSAGRVVERISYDYVKYRYVKSQPPRTGVIQIKSFSKKPTVMKHKYIYEKDRLVSEYIYRPARNLIQRIIYDYDDSGRLFHSKYVEIDGDAIWENFFKYDEHGRKIEWLSNHYDLNDNSVWRYYYDDTGRQTAVECDSTLSGLLRYEYKYDTDGRLIEEACYEKPDELDSKTVYTYNEKGHKVKFEILHRGEISDGHVIFERDENGNILRSKSWHQALTSMTESEFNENSHVIHSLYTKYHCDCTGVKVEPYQLDELEYEYF